MTEPLSKFLGDYYKTHAASPQEQPRWTPQHGGWLDLANDVFLDEGDMKEHIAALEADLKALRNELEQQKAITRRSAEVWNEEEAALRTENEMLRAALEKVARPDRYDAQEMAQIARAALTPPEKEQQG